MKKLVCSLGVLALCLIESPTAMAASCVPAPATLVESGVLTVGTTLGVPPMSFAKDGKPAGFDIDLAAALAKEMCLQPKFVNLAFAGLLPGVDANKFDIASSGIGITAARKTTFDFVPDFVAGVRLIAKKGSNLHFATELDTCGHSVSTRAGSVEANALLRVKAQCAADKPMDLKVYPSDNEAMQQLFKGVVEASFVDWPMAAYAVRTNPDLVEASPILSGDGPGTPRHIDGLALRKGNKALQDALEESMKRVIDNGTYKEVLDAYGLENGNVSKQ
ncbi:ABC transporter substrate-binding protein [Paraburkholderia nemoris]|uniref:ABC transporter substrate-binding protein n=1 Tax=Paraburkholderia nemoris TaxID=2793076 RepID=UPI0038BD6ED9